MVWVLLDVRQLVLEVAKIPDHLFVFNIFLKYFLIHKGVARWPQSWIRVEDQLDKKHHLARMRGALDPRVFRCDHLFIKFLHAVRFKGRSFSDHLVDDAAEGPYVTLLIIWLILPDLWTRIIRCARLSVQHASL